MRDAIEDVLVVGGGDSGLLTALALERLNPDLDVSVVDDFRRDVPQVGKSTFLAIFSLLHDSLAIVEQEMSPWFYDVQSGETRKYNNAAYHLDTERFNAFLRELCRERGISLVKDEINSVDVDASGFNHVIKGELESSYTDFEFPLDSALNSRIDRPLSDVVSATVVESGEYGWFWQIDTWDDRDLGYVYASEFVSDEDARAEFLEYCGLEADSDDVATYPSTRATSTARGRATASPSATRRGSSNRSSPRG